MTEHVLASEHDDVKLTLPLREKGVKDGYDVFGSGLVNPDVRKTRDTIAKAMLRSSGDDCEHSRNLKAIAMTLVVVATACGGVVDKNICHTLFLVNITQVSN